MSSSRTSPRYAHAIGLGIGLGLAAAACNPYMNRDGEYNAGPVDPSAWPATWLGTGGRPGQSGTGSFTALPAFAGGKTVSYFSFPLTTPTASTGSVGLVEDSKDMMGNAIKVIRSLPTPPLAYVFDPDPATRAPFPMPSKCQAPAGYMYNQRNDDVRLDEQGNLFTALPTATYQPLVAEVPVTSKGEACQSIKSEATALTRADVSLPMSTPASGKPVGKSDGSYLAWALIDPAAAVYKAGETAKTSQGLSGQHWGWFNHYLVAYIDGGYVPTQPAMVSDATGKMRAVTQLVTQKLYYPRSSVTTMVMGKPVTAPGAIGQGYDVLEAARGDAAYSPICAVYTYDAGMTAKKPEELPRDAAAITDDTGMLKATIKPDAKTPYVYCFQTL